MSPFVRFHFVSWSLETKLFFIIYFFKSILHLIMIVITLNSFWFLSRPGYFLLKRDTYPSSGDTLCQKKEQVSREVSRVIGVAIIGYVYEGRFRVSGCEKSKIMQVRWLCGVSQGNL
jgi:hypothetical protein